MFILGLNAYHGDSSACLLQDGNIVAAAEEERFRRIKHWAGFPSQAIEYCLSEAGIRLDQVDHIAVNSDPSANFSRKIKYTLLNIHNPSFILSRLANRKKRDSLEAEFKRSFPDSELTAKVHRIEHHLSHLASCYLVSPFEEAVTVSIDGFGDFSSAAWGLGKKDTIDIHGYVHFPHSLGIFYQALTQYIGFPHYGDEYKVMGLAPYGKPTVMDEMRQIVNLQNDGSFKLNTSFFQHHKGNVAYEWEGGIPKIGELFSSELEKLLGPKRKPDEPLEQHHMDIAHSVQAMYEEAFFHLLDILHPKFGTDSLTLAGGCAMNSVANGKVRRRSNFKNLYVQSAAGDAGGAIGSALVAWNNEKPKDNPKQEIAPTCLMNGAKPYRNVMDHAYWGPGFSNTYINKLLEDRSDDLDKNQFKIKQYKNDKTLCEKTALAISEGKVIGWFQGRLEWGPRALGNRSIICDPRRADMKEILNLKIKRRESFRPFAPSIMKEHVSDWFEEDHDVPFMMQVFQIQEDKREQISAVCHADGSGRLQTVYRETNERYWNLINVFHKITNVPMVLNTSFNENEPVVCKPEEALDCFLRTNMDLLVLEDTIIERKR
jgi:carbamoyltransferase